MTGYGRAGLSLGTIRKATRFAVTERTDPVAADHEAEKVDGAFQGALDKLQRVLEKRFGKLASRDGR